MLIECLLYAKHISMDDLILSSQPCDTHLRNDQSVPGLKDTQGHMAYLWTQTQAIWIQRLWSPQPHCRSPLLVYLSSIFTSLPRNFYKFFLVSVPLVGRVEVHGVL